MEGSKTPKNKEVFGSMKQGLFLKFIIFFCLALGLNHLEVLADDLDDLLADAPLTQDSILIDIEEDVGAEFDVVDDIRKRKETFDESLYIAPKYKKPRSFGTPVPFTAQLKKGAILRNLETGKPLRVKKPIVVRAEQILLGANRVYILTKDGQKKYETHAENAVNIENTVRLEPDINPLTVYTDKAQYGSQDNELKFSHFFSYHLEAIRTDYYATIFRGERQSATATILQAKNYLLTERFPIHVGFNLSANLGFWEDPILGTVTWRGFFLGPSFMRTFWKQKDSRWNMHVSAFHSFYHESQKDPDRHRYSTLGLQGELEKEWDTDYGPFILGLSYRWSRSSIKSSTEYLENEALKGQVVGVGAYLSYRYDWSY